MSVPVQSRRPTLGRVSPWHLLLLLTLAASQARALYFYLNVGVGAGAGQLQQHSTIARA